MLLRWEFIWLQGHYLQKLIDFILFWWLYFCMNKYAKHPVWWLNQAHLVNDIYTGMLNPIMPFIAGKLGISMAFATVIMSLSHIFSSLLQPLFGFFADNMVRRVFIFWGLIFTSIFISLAPASQDVFVLILCIILGSLGSSFYHPQALGLVVKFAQNDAAKIMGIFIAMGSIGFSFGPLLSAYVAQYWGLSKMPFLCVPGILTAFMMFWLVPKISGFEYKKSNLKFVDAFRDILKNRKLQILIAIAILKTLITTSCSILLPFLWKSMGYKPFYIGCILFGFIFAGGLGSAFSRTFEKRAGTANIFYTSMISTLPLMIIFSFTYKTFPHIAEVIFILVGFITMLAQPVTMVMAQGVLPQYKSIIGGFINGFSWGVVAIFMSAIGFVAQAKGIMPVLVTISVIPVIFSSLVKYLFEDQKTKI